MNWDTIIGALVIIFIILIIWARVSNQTVVEVIKDIKDIIADRGEDAEETFNEIIEYE